MLLYPGPRSESIFGTPSPLDEHWHPFALGTTRGIAAPHIAGYAHGLCHVLQFPRAGMVERAEDYPWSSAGRTVDCADTRCCRMTSLRGVWLTIGPARCTMKARTTTPTNAYAGKPVRTDFVDHRSSSTRLS